MMSFDTNQALRQRAFQLAQDGDCAAAIPLLYQYLSVRSDDFQALYTLGTCCLRTGLAEEAEKVFRYLAGTGDSADVLNGLGFALAAQNRLDDAKAMYRKALKLDPGHPPTLSNLASIHKFRSGDPWLKRLRKRLAQDDLTPQHRQSLSFALAKAQNDLRNWNGAFQAAKAGAEALMPHYEPERAERGHHWQLASFTKDALAPCEGRGSQTDIPVFIVGMPRSGTTLLSQILSCHPQVSAVGELDYIHTTAKKWAGWPRSAEQMSAGPEWVRAVPDVQVMQDASGYLQELMRRTDGEAPRHVVDKMPGNLFDLGTISTLFPAAKVIFVDRNPYDVAVSCYFARFTQGHLYSYRLDWLGRTILAAEQAAAHFKNVIPNPWAQVSYDALVAAPEAEIRRLLAFLDLPWDPACLQPENASTSVITASVAQVRSGITTSSSERWRRYQSHLGPLFEVLGHPDARDAA